MKMVNIGNENYVAVTEIDMVLDLSSKPTQYKIKEAEDKGKLFSASGDKSSKAIVVLKSGVIIKSPLRITTLIKRIDDCSDKVF